MMKECLDIVMIHAFLDGHLVRDQSTRAPGHSAACGACPMMIRNVEHEADIAAYARRVITLRDGIIISDQEQTPIDAKSAYDKLPPPHKESAAAS